MSAPSDGARADARKRLAAGRERYVPEDATEALGWFIGAQRDQHPRLSTDMDSFDLAAAILASDWLAGVIADAKAEAWDEGFDAGERDVWEHAELDDWSSECIRNPYRDVTE